MTKGRKDIGSHVSSTTIPFNTHIFAVAQEVKSSIQGACIESQLIVVKDKQNLSSSSACVCEGRSFGVSFKLMYGIVGRASRELCNTTSRER